MERYKHFNNWLKNKFGERTLKICLDGGFTCPNRDGRKGYGGCIFCGERGSGENTKRLCIKQQIDNYFNSYKKDRANKFIAYFQNFSNTYERIEKLEEIYLSALCNEKIVALAIATRPDCITKEIAELISKFNKTHYVWVELGLQTANDQKGQILNRGYTSSDFTRAVKLLNEYNIDVVTHIMVGLPNHNLTDVLNTVSFINNHKIKGLKIHSTYVIKNTQLENLYNQNQYRPLEIEEYIQTVILIIKNLRSDIVIHRITGDAPKDLLVAPMWSAHKKRVINAINKILKEEDIYQGQDFK